MAGAPLKVDAETRVYVRVALRDTIEAYDLTDLLDIMAEICQNNADVSRQGKPLGLSAAEWQVRADVLRESAQRLEEQTRGGGGGDGA